MRISLNKMIFAISLLVSSNVFAQVTTDTLDQYADQSQGNYQPMNLNYAGFNNSLGMIQSAWQDPLQNLGEGQSKPAYSKYYWTPDLVLPVRLREGMITMINFPEWELIENIYIGDSSSFDGRPSSPNTVLLYPKSGANVGVDTNVILFGRSGNKYVFYVKSEGVQTERLTNSIIDIDVVDSNNGGNPSSTTGILGSGGSYNHVNAVAGQGGKLVDATYTRRFQKEDWLKSIPLDPAKFRFDIEIYVPNPDDVIIAPERVWRDDIFTYIDLGEKALNMVQRPIVTLIVERVETPVGFRTKGPNNRLIIVEGIGDMVMRSGKRMVCLKLRRSDDEGMQYVSYADDGNRWDVAPKIPGGKQANANGEGSSSESVGRAYWESGKDGEAPKGMQQLPNMVNDEYINANGGAGFSAAGNGCQTQGNSVCTSTSDKSNYAKSPYPNYKYGSGFENQKAESLSIELGTDADVNNLETLWKDLSGKYSNMLGKYEPFYSVDTPADGQGKELFHLRVGPVENLDTGDNICSQLGRSGIFCSVVRIQ